MKNIIYTPEEYMKQGFTEKEVPLITRFDILQNMLYSMTQEERDSDEALPIWEESEKLIKILKI